MPVLASVLTAVVALLHAWFLVLEMFLWRGKIGRGVHGLSPEDAEKTAVLAANQGLYNGFLAVGLVISFFMMNPETARAFRVFFLGCVVVAGAYGGATANRRIFFIQALPGALALAATALA